jgi:hypothetical protein
MALFQFLKIQTQIPFRKSLHLFPNLYPSQIKQNYSIIRISLIFYLVLENFCQIKQYLVHQILIYFIQLKKNIITR